MLTLEFGKYASSLIELIYVSDSDLDADSDTVYGLLPSCLFLLSGVTQISCMRTTSAFILLSIWQLADAVFLGSYIKDKTCFIR